MNRLPVRRTAALLLAGFFGQTAHADPVPLAAQRRPVKPAVQLLGVREAAAPTETARGAPAPAIQPFDPFFDPSAVPTSRPGVAGIMRSNEGPPPPNMYPSGPPIDPRERLQQQATNPPRGVFGMMGDWTSERAKAIKTAFTGPPQPMPVPQVGQFMQPMPTTPMPMGQYGQPMVMSNQPIRGVTPGGRAAYAGNPAYRWYGWGTTTPGSNPYAPAGDYPAASSQWYAMSGATPGAFPAPVTNPFRAPPGPEAPAYAARTTTLPRPVATVPAPTVVFDPPAYGPAPIAESAPFRYLPPDELPVGAVIVPGVPGVPAGPLSAKPKAEPPVGAETVWQPVNYMTPTPPPAPLVGQSSPTTREVAWQTPTAAKPMSMQERVQSVCGTGVSNLEVKQLGRDAVVVRFNAPSDAVAERVAKAISEIAELKPFTVTFDVVVNGR